MIPLPNNALRTAVAALAAAALGAGGVAPVADAGRAPARHHPVKHHRHPAGPTVTIDAGHARPAVPADFLGLSFEVKSLPHIASFSGMGDLVRLMRSLGPSVIRFGGVTADTQAAWSDDGTSRPAWARSTVSPADMRGLGSLARRTGWSVLLTVNLAHYDPDAAGREVSSAVAALGPAFAGVELGNEPDAYGNKGYRPLPWNFSTYQREADNYRAAIQAAIPNVALAGPDVTSSPSLAWIRSEASQEVPALLTAHYYPLNCADQPPPTLGSLLTSAMHHNEQARLIRLAGISRSSRIPMRIGETNNISCGGKPGISNTFASALWGVDYLTRVMTDGIAGINFHGALVGCDGYGPICARTKDDLATGRLRANPEWYALLLARQLLGDRPLPTRLTSSRSRLSVTVLAARGGRLHVVVVNEDPRGTKPVLLHVRLPRKFATGTILRLTGPSLSATSGVELGGRGVSANGAWSAAPLLPRVAPHGRVLTLSVAPAGAELVTLGGH